MKKDYQLNLNMKKISKSKTIINAFTGVIPHGEQWFEERLKSCNSCEYNSKNRKSKNLEEKAQDLLHLGQPYCRVCLCFIDRKAAMKEESCGLKDIGQEPKWNALTVITSGSEDYNLYNNSPEKCSIDLAEDGSHFEVLYGTLKEGDNTSIQLLLEGDYKIEDVIVGCGCTLASWIKISDKLTEMNVSLNMTKVNKGTFRKNIYVKYIKKEQENKITISLKGIKK